MTLSPLEQARAHQTAAADPGRSVFVTANAGSGKTTTLVDRVARLLLKEASPGEILCVTYTKAAAAEKQSRLFDKLGVWAVADNNKREMSFIGGSVLRMTGTTCAACWQRPCAPSINAAPHRMQG